MKLQVCFVIFIASLGLANCQNERSTRYLFYATSNTVYLTYRSQGVFGVSWSDPIPVPTLPIYAPGGLYTRLGATSYQNGVYLVYQDSDGNIVQTSTLDNGQTWSNQLIIVPSSSTVLWTPLAYITTPTPYQQAVFFEYIDPSNALIYVRAAVFNGASWSVLSPSEFYYQTIGRPLTAFAWVNYIRVYYINPNGYVTEIEGAGISSWTSTQLNLQLTSSAWNIAGVYTIPGDTADLYYSSATGSDPWIHDYVWPTWGLTGISDIINWNTDNLYVRSDIAAITDNSYIYLYTQSLAPDNSVYEYYIGHGYAKRVQTTPIAVIPDALASLAATVI